MNSDADLEFQRVVTRRNEVLAEACRLAKDLWSVDVKKNLFERVVLSGLQDPGPQWLKGMLDLLQALRSSSTVNRSKNLASGLLKMPQILTALLQDRRWSSEEKREILAYARWELLVQEKQVGDPSTGSSSAPPVTRLTAAQELAKEKAILDALPPAEKLRKLLEDVLQREVHQRRDWLLSLVGRDDPFPSFGRPLAELKDALAKVFLGDVAEMRAVVLGDGPEQKRLQDRLALQEKAKPGSSSHKSQEAGIQKAKEAAEKERKRADRYRPFLDWLDQPS